MTCPRCSSTALRCRNCPWQTSSTTLLPDRPRRGGHCRSGRAAAQGPRIACRVRGRCDARQRAAARPSRAGSRRECTDGSRRSHSRTRGSQVCSVTGKAEPSGDRSRRKCALADHRLLAAARLPPPFGVKATAMTCDVPTTNGWRWLLAATALSSHRSRRGRRVDSYRSRVAAEPRRRPVAVPSPGHGRTPADPRRTRRVGKSRAAARSRGAAARNGSSIGSGSRGRAAARRVGPLAATRNLKPVHVGCGNSIYLRFSSSHVASSLRRSATWRRSRNELRHNAAPRNRT